MSSRTCRHAAAKKQENWGPLAGARWLRLAQLVQQLRHGAKLTLWPQERHRLLLQVRLHFGTI